MTALNAEPDPPIGGFFERHVDARPAPGPSVLDAWTGGRPHAAFVNARSAFAALAAQFPTSSIWLPAFICNDLIQPAYADRLRFYPVHEGFEPALAAVETEAAPGDIVLVATHFGQPLGAATRQALARRPDLRVVEDRAQALDAGPGLGRGWRIYSPRKLLGVADGGLLVSDEAVLPEPTQAPDSAALWAAPNLRFSDPLGCDNARWHAANQAREAAMAAGDQAMSPLSLSILAQTSLAPLATDRMRNWRALDERLRAWSAMPADPAAPPLGYVLRLDPPRRDSLLKALHARRIFAAVHWPAIAAPAADFPRETAWTRELITLPCDHRYGAGEMARIADLVIDHLR